MPAQAQAQAPTETPALTCLGLASVEEALALGMPVHAPVLRLQRRTVNRRQAICLLRRCLNPQRLALEPGLALPAAWVQRAVEEDAEAGTEGWAAEGSDRLLDALLRSSGWSPNHSRERLRAVPASVSQAAGLGLRPGTALLQLEQWRCNALGQVLEWQLSLQPGLESDHCVELRR